MARPRKQGLDYFPWDTVPDKKLERFYLLFEAKGRSFWSAMLEEVYREGSSVDVSEAETRLILSRKCLCTLEEWGAMLSRALKEQLFDAKEYEERRIITSKGIKKRFAAVSKKRKQNADYYKNRVSESETTTESEHSAGFHFTRESKGKKRKGNKKKSSPPTPSGALLDVFEQARKAYPGVKRDLALEFGDFQKRYAGKETEIIPLLLPAVTRYKAHLDKRGRTAAQPLFVKNFDAWLSQGCWTMEFPGDAKNSRDERQSSRPDIEALIAADDAAWLAMSPEEQDRQTRESMEKAAPLLSAGAKTKATA